MIKVLQVIPGLNRGGLETFVMNVFRSIDRSKVSFEFLTNMEAGDYSEEIKELGGIIHYIPPRNKGLKRFRQNLKRFFEKHIGEYDAIHYHESSLTSLEVLYYARKADIPIRIMHSHSSSIMGNKLHYLTHFLGKLAISKLATNYVGCSDKALDWMFDYTGVRDKAFTVYNGINTGLFSYNPERRKEIRAAFDIKPDELVIGHVGRLTPVKNHTYLLDIFNELHKKHNQSRLLLIGIGNLENELKGKVREFNLEDSVTFLGSRSDTFDLYQAMDIFVMPSLYEGLPIVLVEAQASGLPVLCSDNISMDSKLTDNYHTLSIYVSPTVWADEILMITSDFVRKNETYNIQKAGFDINNVAETLLKIYQNG